MDNVKKAIEDSRRTGKTVTVGVLPDEVEYALDHVMPYVHTAMLSSDAVEASGDGWHIVLVMV